MNRWPYFRFRGPPQQRHAHQEFTSFSPMFEFPHAHWKDVICGQNPSGFLDFFLRRVSSSHPARALIVEMQYPLLELAPRSTDTLDISLFMRPDDVTAARLIQGELRLQCSP